jgi:hypothetical protein
METNNGQGTGAGEGVGIVVKAENIADTGLDDIEAGDLEGNTADRAVRSLIDRDQGGIVGEAEVSGIQAGDLGDSDRDGIAGLGIGFSRDLERDGRGLGSLGGQGAR